ncbi:MAG: methyltransferase [Planctomycetes bacterium]|nr:methyltransferase [Planctomycetota bacterium]
MTVLSALKKSELAVPKVYRAEFVMSLPRGESVTLATLPGVFTHRRVDTGAQALAEAVESRPGDSILDMGCGCGSIGISLAKNQPGSSVCFVDSHARAVTLTEENCRANGLMNYRVLLSDQGLPPPPGFTLFVGNPPYFSHDRIAELFMRTAFEVLLPQGRAYIVAKKADHHLGYMGELFGNAELTARRGYQIVKSVKD